MICDFCTAPAPTWEYPTRDFAYGPQVSLGGWMACEVCHRLIESGDQTRLADRSLDTFLRRQRISQAESGEVLAILRDLHQAFWSERLGEPVRRL